MPLRATLRDELESLDERIEAADREGDPRGGGDEALALRLRRERLQVVLGAWGPQDDLRRAMEFGAATIDAVSELDGPTCDHLTAALMPAELRNRRPAA